jgi:hypothetical protein
MNELQREWIDRYLVRHWTEKLHHKILPWHLFMAMAWNRRELIARLHRKGPA